jgi:hypothetical protein
MAPAERGRLLSLLLVPFRAFALFGAGFIDTGAACMLYMQKIIVEGFLEASSGRGEDQFRRKGLGNYQCT